MCVCDVALHIFGKVTGSERKVENVCARERRERVRHLLWIRNTYASGKRNGADARRSGNLLRVPTWMLRD
jgi:hypothetical protein